MQYTEYIQSLDLNSTDCENLCLKISLKNGKEIVLGVLYQHPRADIHDFQEKLNESICKLNSLKLKFYVCGDQRWSPRGHILKSLASRPQVLENWPVLGSRTTLFIELLKFCGALEKLFGKRFFVEIA